VFGGAAPLYITALIVLTGGCFLHRAIDLADSAVEIGEDRGLVLDLLDDRRDAARDIDLSGQLALKVRAGQVAVALDGVEPISGSDCFALSRNSGSEGLARSNHFRRPRWLPAIPSTKVTMLLRMFWFSISEKARTNRTEAAVSRNLRPSLMFSAVTSLPEAP